jgi:hypothetical protein
MKKVIIFVAILFSINRLKAQTNYTPAGNWKCISGNDTLIIFFKSSQMNVGGTIQPILIGFHKYIKNGALVENSLQFQQTDYPDDKYSIIILNFQQGDARNDGILKDISLNYTRAIILTKLNPNSMNVRLTSFQDRRKNGTISGYTLPRNFQLTQ